MGEMADLSMYDDPFGEEWAQRIEDGEGPAHRQCDYCGTRLVFFNMKYGWRLFNLDGTPHFPCRQETKDAFADLK